MKRLLIVAALSLAPACALAQGILGFPPGVFTNRAALDAASAGPTTIYAPIFMLLSSGAYGSTTAYIGAAPNGAGTSGFVQSTEVATVPVAVGGTFFNMSAKAPAWTAGDAYETLWYGAAGALPTAPSSPLAVDINSASVVSDTAHTQAVNAPSGGACDLLTVQHSTANSWATAQINLSMMFETTSAGFPLLGFSNGNLTAGYYMGLGIAQPLQTTDAAASTRFAIPGTIKNLCVYSSAAAGSGSKSWTLTAYHDTETTYPCDTSAATSLAATITGAGTAGQNGTDLASGHGFHVAAGDCVSFLISSNASPTAGKPGLSVEFDPDPAYAGHYPIMSNGIGQGTSPTRYANVEGYAGNISSWSSHTNGAQTAILPPMPAGTSQLVFQDFNVMLCTATTCVAGAGQPGASASREYQFQIGASTPATPGSGPDCTISGASALTCSSAATYDAGSSAGSLVDVVELATGSPTDAAFKFSWDVYVH